VKTLGKTWETMGKPWEKHNKNHGTTLGKTWETMGKPWGNHGKNMEKLWENIGTVEGRDGCSSSVPALEGPTFPNTLSP